MGSHSSDANDIRVRLTEAYRRKQEVEQKKRDSFNHERAREEGVYLTAFAKSFGQDLISLSQSLLQDLGAANPQLDKKMRISNEINKPPESLWSLFKPRREKAQPMVGYVFKPNTYLPASRWSLKVAEEGFIVKNPRQSLCRGFSV